MDTRKLVVMVVLALMLLLAWGQVEAGRRQPCKHIKVRGLGSGCYECCLRNHFDEWDTSCMNPFSRSCLCWKY